MFIKTDYSLLESSIQIKKDLEKIKDNFNYSSLILSDDNLSGVLEFYYKTKSLGINPIIGLEKEFENVKYLFIAKNKRGYSLLTRMETLGVDKSYFDKKDLIVFATDIMHANAKILSNYSLKVPEFDDLSKIKNQILNKNTKQFDVSIYNALNKSDRYIISSLTAIKHKEKSYEFETVKKNYYFSPLITKGEFQNKILKSDYYLEFINLLKECVDDYNFGKPVPPSYKMDFKKKEFGEIIGNETDERITDALILRHLSWEGLRKRKKDHLEEYRKRLEYELGIIEKMKFPGYFLIVRDYINYAKKMKIPVGPGRGSAAGSLVAYCLEITDLDPIPHGLLFERFLNPERVSLPDIDTDFCQYGREKVISYVVNKYGKYNTAQVITFGTIGAKNAIRDAARILNAPLKLADKIAKLIPEKPGIKLSECKGIFNENFDENDELPWRIINKAFQIENFKKSHGAHAAGVVVSNDEIYNRAPLYEVNLTRVVGFAGNYLEDVNLVKYDFLGLKTLTLIDFTLKDINKLYGKNFIIDESYLNQEEIYKYISTGNTIGIFQLESDGMQDLAKRLQPKNFEELTAMLALYRPGPMEAGMLESFIKRKHGQEEVDYFFKEMEPVLKPILEPTYGLIVYQEQVMQIVQEIAGFTLGEADLVRRAMGKKKAEEMAKIKNDFVKRAVERGYKEEQTKELFDMIEKFAGYGFNKSHSAAYAFISFQTAWLKYHYPKEFMKNLINLDIDNQSKVAKYLDECKRLNINITKPDIKISKELFEINPNKNELIFGLKLIKGVGSGAKHLIEEANNFEDFFEFIKHFQEDKTKQEKELVKEFNKILRRKQRALKKRDQLLKKGKEAPQELIEELSHCNAKELDLNVKLEELRKELKDYKKPEKINKRVFESLAKAGAFNSFNITRKDLIDNMKEILSLNFDKVNFTGREYPLSEIIEIEKELIEYIITSIWFEEIYQYDLNGEWKPFFILNKVEKKSKNGKKYYIINVVNTDGFKETVFDFNNVFADNKTGEYYLLKVVKDNNFIHLKEVETIDKINQFLSPKKKEIKILDNISSEDLKDIGILKIDDDILGVSLIIKY